MMQKHPNGFYQSTLLQKVPSLVHAFSGRTMGDMKKDLSARKRFFKSVGMERNVSTPEQIHGSFASSLDDPKGSDGLVGRGTVGIFTADCIPILAVDPVTRIVAGVHAGWRGTLGKIAKNAVEKMQEAGANSSNILVWIGPHIGMCCYSVDEDRKEKYTAIFGDNPSIVSFFENSWHLDLGYVNYSQLVESGIKPEHLDFALTCTSCQNDEFFSYRKDRKDTFGEMMGVIGWK